jgi:peptide/nickel transport system permease protein
MLDILQESYVTTARAKGVPEQAVMVGHAFRNVLPSIISVIGFQLGALLGGTLILESIFGLPGLGRALAMAALERDYPVVQSLATLLVFAMLSIGLVTDLLHAKLDPRVTFSTRPAS